MQELGKSIDKMEPFETMAVSERTVIFRGTVFSIGSGNEFEALSKSVSGNLQVLRSEMVPHTDKICYLLSSDEGMRFIFKNDAGRRDCCPLGYRVLCNVVSATALTHERILFQILQGFKQDGSKFTYWALMSPADELFDISDDLAAALSEDMGIDQKKEDFNSLGFCAIPPRKRGGVQKEVQLCTKRGVTQLMIFQPNRKIFRPNDIAQSPGRFQFGKPYLAICHLAKSGYLIRKCYKHLKRPESTVQDLVLQNCWGDMLHIYCTNSSSRERLTKPRYYALESLEG